MTKKDHKQTPAEAGQANLEKWLEANPSRGNLKHGAHSVEVKAKYASKRFKEGRHMARIMKALVDDLGGHEAVTAAQQLLLDNIRSKLIVLLSIGKFIDCQELIISPSGELLPCLGRNYTAYSEALRRDLVVLKALGKGNPKIQPYEKILKALESGE